MKYQFIDEDDKCKEYKSFYIIINIFGTKIKNDNYLALDVKKENINYFLNILRM